jgi:hypothetical protein
MKRAAAVKEEEWEERGAEKKNRKRVRVLGRGMPWLGCTAPHP